MKVVLLMAMTPNGVIAKENDDTTFVTVRSWKSFLRKVKDFGHVVIGRRTYDATDPAEFVKNSLYVVMTHEKSLEKKTPKVIFTDESPQDILNMLEKMGFKKVLIAGGGKLNSVFMKAGLIDEIYFDVQPVIFGKGIRVFAEEDFQARLRLIEVKKYSKSEAQLHYKVINTRATTGQPAGSFGSGT
jgi:dihydrofolate reductase